MRHIVYLIDYKWLVSILIFGREDGYACALLKTERAEIQASIVCGHVKVGTCVTRRPITGLIHDQDQFVGELALSLQKLRCRSFDDLESEIGGFALEIVDLQFAVLGVVKLRSSVDEWHSVAQ